MKFIRTSHLWLALLAIGLLSCSQKEETDTASDEKKSVHMVKARHVTTDMKVKEINLEERLFTLQYAEGNMMVVKVDPNIVGLEKIQVGDDVEVKYFKSLAVFVGSPDTHRPPVSEKKTVTVEIEEGKPVEYTVDVIEKVSTVIEIHHEKREAVLKDPEGNIHEVDISHLVENLEDVAVGDQIVYHYTESMAVHIAKVESQKI